MTRFNGGLGSAGLKVELDNLRGLFQLELDDSMILICVKSLRQEESLYSVWRAWHRQNSFRYLCNTNSSISKIELRRRCIESFFTRKATAKSSGIFLESDVVWCWETCCKPSNPMGEWLKRKLFLVMAQNEHSWFSFMQRSAPFYSATCNYYFPNYPNSIPFQWNRITTFIPCHSSYKIL